MDMKRNTLGKVEGYHRELSIRAGFLRNQALDVLVAYAAALASAGFLLVLSLIGDLQFG
jgi:hypothetical protein